MCWSVSEKNIKTVCYNKFPSHKFPSHKFPSHKKNNSE